MSQGTIFYFIRFAELRKILGGVSRSKIERDVASGVLPRPYRLGKRMIAWRSDEIAAYLNNLPRHDDAYACRNRNSQMRRTR